MTDLAAGAERPVPSLAIGLVGAALLANAGRRTPSQRLLLAAGLGAIAWALRPVLRDWLVRTGTARRTVRVSTTLDIRRPVTEVFAFCKDFENFPRAFPMLRSVTDFQDGRSHWEIRSPAGRTISWDAIVTKYVPSSVIGWANVRGAIVQSTGLIRFEATGPASTRLTIEAVYVPGETGLADAIHAITSQRRQAQIRGELQTAARYIESLPAPGPDGVLGAAAAAAETADGTAAR